MKYKGMELEEITTPQIFDPPRKCVVWDDKLSPYEDYVLAITAEKINPVVTWLHTFRQHCAILPEEPKPRRATNRELARWLAQGNGELLNDITIETSHSYKDVNLCDEECWMGMKVRKWDDTDWHEPTVDYMGLEGK